MTTPTTDKPQSQSRRELLLRRLEWLRDLPDDVHQVEAWLRERAGPTGCCRVATEIIASDKGMIRRRTGVSRVRRALEQLSDLRWHEGRQRYVPSAEVPDAGPQRLVRWDPIACVVYLPGICMASPPRPQDVARRRRHLEVNVPDCELRTLARAELEASFEASESRRRARQDAASQRQADLPGVDSPAAPIPGTTDPPQRRPAAPRWATIVSEFDDAFRGTPVSSGSVESLRRVGSWLEAALEQHPEPSHWRALFLTARRLARRQGDRMVLRLGPDGGHRVHVSVAALLSPEVYDYLRAQAGLPAPEPTPVPAEVAGLVRDLVGDLSDRMRSPGTGPPMERRIEYEPMPP